MPGDTNFDTGAVRSADRNHLDFTSLPIIGLLGLARTAHEGGSKYGRFNYLQGLPPHDAVNHAIVHLLMWSAGDRSEPHLSHAAWGCLVAAQTDLLNPELSAPHLPGPGFTLTEAMLAHLEANKEDLARRRAAGEFDGTWDLKDVPEVARLLEQRQRGQSEKAPTTELGVLGSIADDVPSDQAKPACALPKIIGHKAWLLLSLEDRAQYQTCHHRDFFPAHGTYTLRESFVNRGNSW